MMGYEKKLASSFKQAEPQKLVYGLLLACFLVLLTYFSISKPYDAILSTISLKLSSSNSLQSDLIHKERMSNNTSEQAGLENALIESKINDCNNISSRLLHLCHGNLMQRNSSSQVHRPDPPPPIQSDEGKDIPPSDEKKDELAINLKKLKSICNYSDKNPDFCELHGDGRIILNHHPSIIFVNNNQTNETLTIQPYTHKYGPSAIRNVKKISIRSSPIPNAPPCTQNHTSPAIIFSAGGYAGNYYHDFFDILIPLFQASYGFQGKVHFFVSDLSPWWINKYLPIFKSLSNYSILNFDKTINESTHCFPQISIGLQTNSDMSKNLLISKNGLSIDDFTEFLRKAYFLPRKMQEIGIKKPKLLIIERRRTRKILNIEKIMRMAENLGFEVVVAEADGDVERFARVVNTCDVMMGVHGAGLANIMFLPINAIVIQVIPLGKLNWISRTCFKEPAISMKLRYLEYEINEEESSLMEIYGRDDTVLRDPYAIHKLGWNDVKKIYLDKQNVKLDLRRFRVVLVEALKLLLQKES